MKFVVISIVSEVCNVSASNDLGRAFHFDAKHPVERKGTIPAFATFDPPFGHFGEP